jgi:hypothetical protein
VLWDYSGRTPSLFDCPSEKVAVYADGVSSSDAALGGFMLDWRTDWKHCYGFASPYEVWNASGIGVAGGHWIPIVVAFPGEEDDPSRRRIAYLEKYSPDLKLLLERVKAAHAARRPTRERIPPPDSRFCQDNTLVRRLDETDWHEASSPEGRKTMSEWRSRTGPRGQRPIVCVP